MELDTEICFENNGYSLMITCPDEDSEFGVIAKERNGDYTAYSLTIDEAEKLMQFLKVHIKNEKEHCKCINNSWNRDAGCFVCDYCGKRI